MLHRTIIALTAALLLSACATVPAPAEAPLVQTKGLVRAADRRAAEAGAEMLRQGGSPTEAAIATMLALTVVEPQSSGIGGGGFLLHHSGDGELDTLDGRETAPAGADPQWFLDPEGKPLPYMQAVVSGRSVGVPGNIRLAAEAHRRWGKLPWATLFEPAIRLAGEGWYLTERGREFLVNAKNRAAHQEDAEPIFYDEAGEARPAGTLLRNRALAETLRQIARHGPEWFYTSANARAIAAEVVAETPRAGAMTV